MHINYARGETRTFVGRRRRYRTDSAAGYKRDWNRHIRRWLKSVLSDEEDGPATSCSAARRQKTRHVHGW